VTGVQTCALPIYSDEQIKKLILKDFADKKIAVLAPLIKSRKGHYRELFEQISKQGFLRARVDGEIREIEKGMKLDRYKNHDIEVVIDRLAVNKSAEKRLEETIKTAMYSGDNIIMVIDIEDNDPRYFSRELMCPTSGIAYPNPEPNTFSFNSPKGACDACNGLGVSQEINLQKVIPDNSISIKAGGIVPLGEEKNSWIFHNVKLFTTETLTCGEVGAFRDIFLKY
jgi:excinuclease ABC subunit A